MGKEEKTAERNLQREVQEEVGQTEATETEKYQQTELGSPAKRGLGMPVFVCSHPRLLGAISGIHRPCREETGGMTTRERLKQCRNH